MIDEVEFFDEHLEQQNHIADHIFGVVARRDGKPLDQSKSADWQRGWSLMLASSRNRVKNAEAERAAG